MKLGLIPVAHAIAMVAEKMKAILPLTRLYRMCVVIDVIAIRDIADKRFKQAVRQDAQRIWRETNGPNYERYILPSKAQCDTILLKGADHHIAGVYSQNAYPQAAYSQSDRWFVG